MNVYISERLHISWSSRVFVLLTSARKQHLSTRQSVRQTTLNRLKVRQFDPSRHLRNTHPYEVSYVDKPTSIITFFYSKGGSLRGKNDKEEEDKKAPTSM